MSSQRSIKKRLSSVKNIRKISKALEMVAASKVQKAQDKAAASKPFAEIIYSLITNIGSKITEKELPLLRTKRISGNRLIVLVSSDRGLCGSLNANLLRFTANFINDRKVGKDYFITVGKKGRSTALENGELIADFSEIKPREDAIPFIIKTVTEEFIAFKVDSVYVVYNDFISALSQEAKIKQILPLERLQGEEDLEQNKHEIKYEYEPSRIELLSIAVPFFLETQIRDVFYESEASEHSARMVAMKNATDNADNLSYNLNLQYNKARQQVITSEISDIVTASLSLSKNE